MTWRALPISPWREAADDRAGLLLLLGKAVQVDPRLTPGYPELTTG